jgi:hypothetical protein
MTEVPLGRGIASIGLAIASIALIAVAPYAAPALAGVLGGAVSVGAVQAGLVIGGVALGYAAQASAAAKKKTERSLSSVTGGGNVPKPGARKPLLYGRCWSTPPLSQKDFITYDGDTMVLTKRMTLGIGRFQIHAEPSVGCRKVSPFRCTETMTRRLGGGLWRATIVESRRRRRSGSRTGSPRSARRC